MQIIQSYIHVKMNLNLNFTLIEIINFRWNIDTNAGSFTYIVGKDFLNSTHVLTHPQEKKTN